MHFVLVSAWKDLRRLRRDPVSLLVWIGIPVFVGGMLSLVFGGSGGATPHGRLLVADQDQTLFGTVITGAFSQGPLAKMVLLEKVEREEGVRRMNQGDASALLIIPKGAGAAYWNNQPTELQLITNPSQRILPQIIEEALSMTLEAGFYLQAFAGDEFPAFVKGPEKGAGTLPDGRIAELSVTVNHLLGRVRKFIDPPLIQLDKANADTKTEAPLNFGAIFFPGMLMFALLFVAQGLAVDLWRERMQGTLRRLMTTPSGLGWFLGGKLTAAFAVFALVAIAGLACARWLIRMDMGHPIAAFLWIACSGAAFYLLFLLLQIQASSQRAGSVMANLVVFPLLMVGGCMFPFRLMPESLARIGRKTPNGFVLLQLQHMLDNTADAATIFAAFAGLAAVVAVAYLLILRGLRRRFVF